MISHEELKKYWDKVKAQEPKLFKNRNQKKRNEIIHFMLDYWEDDYISRRKAEGASEDDLYYERALGSYYYNGRSIIEDWELQHFNLHKLKLPVMIVRISAVSS